MVMEYARHVLGLEGASSSEFDPQTPHPVIATIKEQEEFVDGAGDLGGTMRLGAYPAVLREGSVLAQTYGATEVSERHRHRYEVNNAYREQLEAAGLHMSGTSLTDNLLSLLSCHAMCTPTMCQRRHTRSLSRAQPTLTRCFPG